MLQRDIRTRTMIDVSDRIADNRDGQFEFELSTMQAVITEPRDADKRSVDCVWSVLLFLAHAA